MNHTGQFQVSLSPEQIEWEDILSSKYHGFYHSLFCTRPNGKRKPICNPNDMRIQNSCNVSGNYFLKE